MMFIGLALTSCEPMEDIHDEVDERLANMPIEGVAEYTLTEDDYDALEVSEGNFSSLEDASALIPNLLAEKFPVWGEGSLALVTFDLNAPIRPEDYVVQPSDYAAIGLDVDYFSDLDEVQNFLEFQFPQAPEGKHVELIYRTIPEEIEFEFTDDDFDLVGELLEGKYGRPASSAAQYGNFDRREGNAAYWSNEMILEAVDLVLAENFEGVEGQTYEVSYDIYDGESGTESMDVKFDGTNYVRAGAIVYGFDNSIYDLVGEELGDEYPGPAGNAAQYNSFSVVEGSSTYWSSEMILEAINVALLEAFPDASEGAEFMVNYTVYNGTGTEPASMAVVLSGAEYIIDETPPVVSTIMTTEVFALTNGTWDQPLTLPENVYQDEFGQRFRNFDDEAEAGFYIGRYIEPQFPYAEEGDMVSVAYNFYNGDETVTAYTNFIYDDGEFSYIPSVIAETLQFGHNGVEWEVDNTTLYTLTAADFGDIGEALIEKYPNPADNAGYFGSFDRREGSNNYWSPEMLLEAVTVILNEIAPNPEEGQKYVISYAAYTGSTVIETIRVIYLDGEWVLNE